MAMNNNGDLRGLTSALTARDPLVIVNIFQDFCTSSRLWLIKQMETQDT